MRSSIAFLALAASVAAQNSTSNTTLAAALNSTSDLSSLAALLTQLNLVSAVSAFTNVTILAPSNAAFTKYKNNSASNVTLGSPDLTTALLTYHVLNGTYNSSQITSTPSFIPTHLTNTLVANVTGGQRVEALNSSGTVSILSGLLTNSTVTKADIAYNNGIIHIIDTVLEPPQDVAETAEAFNLTAVVGALTQLKLADVVDETADLTIFAPDNDAFQAIASVLSGASPDTLTNVLKYHVVPGKVLYSSDITSNTTLTTLANSTLNIAVANGSVFVNSAKVVTKDVLVANGVVHVINGVLNPASNMTAGSNSTAFANATSSSAVPFTSGVPTPTSVVSVPSQATATATSSTGSSSNVAARAMATGVIGAGVLFAGAFLGL